MNSEDADAHLLSDRHRDVRSASSDAGGKHSACVIASRLIAPSGIPLICLRLQELQNQRKFMIGAYNKQVVAAGALLRRALNFDPSAEDSDRDAIANRALRIVGKAFAGKPQDEADREILAPIETDINVVAKAVEPLKARRVEIEKEMAALGKRLPVSLWAKGVAGLGPVGLTVIIGETGDLSNYPNFRHVWKRLGMMPFEGKACSTWRRENNMPEGGWLRVGYSPKRHAQIYACVTEPMMKHQIEGAAKTETEFGLPKQKYGAIYVARREKTKLEHSDWSKKHALFDATNIMTKALVSDLWLEWRRASTCCA